MRRILEHIKDFLFGTISVLSSLCMVAIVAILLISCSNYYDDQAEKEQISFAEDYMAENAAEYVHNEYFIGDVYPKDEIESYMNDNDPDYMKEYVADMYYIDDVFSQDECDQWAKDYIHDIYFYDLKEVFSEDEIKEYAHDFYFPEEIFSE